MPVVRDHTGQTYSCFSLSGETFTLESIISIGLDQFADTIGDISGAASKELAIEEALEAIALQWKDLTLDIDRYKDRGHYRLKSVILLCQNWRNG